jgi:sulfate transport system permease protein
MPLQVEILYNEYNSVAAFAVASLLALLALLTLAARAALEARAPEMRYPTLQGAAVGRGA